MTNTEAGSESDRNRDRQKRWLGTRALITHGRTRQREASGAAGPCRPGLAGAGGAPTDLERIGQSPGQPLWSPLAGCCPLTPLKGSLESASVLLPPLLPLLGPPVTPDGIGRVDVLLPLAVELGSQIKLSVPTRNAWELKQLFNLFQGYLHSAGVS